MNKIHPQPRLGIGKPGFDHIFKVLWCGRRNILIGAGIGLVLAVLYLNTATVEYSAELTVVPTQISDGSSQRVGDLASLAGVNLRQSQGSGPFQLYSSIMRSRAVADEMSRKPDVMQRVFYSRWDPVSKTWRKPSGFVSRAIRMVKSGLGLPVMDHDPSGDDMRKFISANVVAEDDPKKPITVVKFTYKDPVFAAYFLQALHETTDNLLRRTSLQRASQYANYLKNKLDTVQQADLRKVLVDSFSQQETLLMMGSSAAAFAAQPLGNAKSTDYPTSPKSFKVLEIAMGLGIFAGIVASIYEISLWAKLLTLFNTAKMLVGRRWPA